jgi:hypothetical protein
MNDGPAVTPQTAKWLDEKIDDGKPRLGKLKTYQAHYTTVDSARIYDQYNVNQYTYCVGWPTYEVWTLEVEEPTCYIAFDNSYKY